MRIRIITLRFNDILQGFPEEPLVQATAGKEVLDFKEHFFVHGNVPHLTLVVSLGESERKKEFSSIRGEQENPAKDLSEEMQKVYQELKKWRNERATRDGIPSYMIARNAQLAAICRRHPGTISELREIEGIGEATCSKYGQELLSRLPVLKSAAESAEPEKGAIP